MVDISLRVRARRHILESLRGLDKTSETKMWKKSVLIDGYKVCNLEHVLFYFAIVAESMLRGEL